jgi:hypothetical protein
MSYDVTASNPLELLYNLYKGVHQKGKSEAIQTEEDALSRAAGKGMRGNQVSFDENSGFAGVSMGQGFPKGGGCSACSNCGRCDKGGKGVSTRHGGGNPVDRHSAKSTH